MTRRLAACSIVLLVAGCATQRPVIYPNAHAQAVGEAQQRRDVDECIALADDTASSGEAGALARDTAVGGTIGAASGAAGGAVYGNAGTGAAAGAAGGAVAGFLGRLFRPRPPNPGYVGVTNQCLQERGYRVAGWQ
jgi:hypothetical protein